MLRFFLFLLFMNRIDLLFCVFLLFMLIAGCRTSQTAAPLSASASVEYSIIYVIHGDANYRFHDENGTSLQADEEVLNDAKNVGRKATNGEVFIFHQKPERKILWLFPKKDRQFLHYRNGALVNSQSYSPQSEQQSFVKESDLYREYTAKQSRGKNVLLYYGHQIPDSEEIGYHKSRPNAVFNTTTFTNGLESFIDEEQSFDLTVLSTCNNGTPAMIHALRSATKYVLASPQNLHLSHIDSQPLLELNRPNRQEIRSAQLARQLAEKNYDRLSGFLQTVITLSIYDYDSIQGYLPGLNNAYQNYLADNTGNSLLTENTDCASLSFFDASRYKKGIQLWFKPPAFGTKKNNSTYSGWGCRKKDPE